MVFLKKLQLMHVLHNLCFHLYFLLTYPLDEGGYNYGIRYRKSSYIESIKKKYNRNTILISSCNAMGIGTSFDRGFDEILTTFDFRL